jgi:hypothetical protein
VDTFQFNTDGPAVMVLIKRRRARPSDTDRAAPEESLGGPINCSDVGYGDQVPGGASQAPVLGFQVRLHARGCTAQTVGYVGRPPSTGPFGPMIW